MEWELRLEKNVNSIETDYGIRQKVTREQDAGISKARNNLLKGGCYLSKQISTIKVSAGSWLAQICQLLSP